MLAWDVPIIVPTTAPIDIARRWSEGRSQRSGNAQEIAGEMDGKNLARQSVLGVSLIHIN